MPSIYLLPLVLSLAALACLLAGRLKKSSAESAARRIEAERAQAYRALHGLVGSGRLPAKFSYRPATGELILDAEAARMHGLAPGEAGMTGEVRLDGWHLLPAAARAAGWIDEALADGLQRREAVCCEYLARVAGRPDRSVKLTARPVQRSGLLVGFLEERPKAGN